VVEAFEPDQHLGEGGGKSTLLSRKEKQGRRSPKPRVYIGGRSATFWNPRRFAKLNDAESERERMRQLGEKEWPRLKKKTLLPYGGMSIG